MSMRPLTSLKIIAQYTLKLEKKVQVGTELQSQKIPVNKAWTGRSGELYLVTKMTGTTTVAYTMFSLYLRLKTFSVARQFRIECLISLGTEQVQLL